MKREEFNTLFKEVCTLHETICEEALALNKDWELSDPVPFFAVKLGDEDAQPFPAPPPLASGTLPPEQLGNFLRGMLKELAKKTPEELARMFYGEPEDGRPQQAELVAAGVASEGWFRDARSGERSECISLVILEDKDYNVGMAYWEKDDENARLVLKRSEVTKSLHDIESNLGNLFSLPPRSEYAH